MTSWRSRGNRFLRPRLSSPRNLLCQIIQRNYWHRKAALRDRHVGLRRVRSNCWASRSAAFHFRPAADWFSSDWPEQHQSPGNYTLFVLAVIASVLRMIRPRLRQFTVRHSHSRDRHVPDRGVARLERPRSLGKILDRAHRPAVNLAIAVLIFAILYSKSERSIFSPSCSRMRIWPTVSHSPIWCWPDSICCRHFPWTAAACCAPFSRD